MTRRAELVGWLLAALGIQALACGHSRPAEVSLVGGPTGAVAPRARCPSDYKFVPEATVELGYGLSPYAGYKTSATEHLSAFCIMENEVSVTDYTSCVSAGVCSHSPDCNPFKPKVQGCLTFPDLQSYCGFVHGRPPTESEWEYAGRGGDGRRWPWSLDDAEACPERAQRRCDISPFGVRGMAYGVQEWTTTISELVPDARSRPEVLLHPGGKWLIAKGYSDGSDVRESEHIAYRGIRYEHYTNGLMGGRCVVDPK